MRYLIVAFFVSFGLHIGVQAGEEKNELVPVKSIGEVNTATDEVDPFLYGESLLLFASNKNGTFDLMVSKQSQKTKQWDEAIEIPGLNTKDADERSPIFTTKFRFYFSSNRVPDPMFKSLKNYDLFMRKAPREPFALRLVNTKVDEKDPWITGDRRAMYCSRKTREGWRIVATKGPAAGGPAEAKMVGGIPVGFTHPAVTDSRLTMYLQGPIGNDRTGIFVSKRRKTSATWGKPMPVINLNHPKGKRGDISPSLAANGRLLLFASDRPGGQGGFDIYAVETSKLKAEGGR